ncbi:MAG: hypothetical protein ACYSTF_05500, partial [Planctomycetota bacterium]
SSDTSPEQLRELAKVCHSFVQTAVARNPNTESDVLSSLMPDKIQSYNEQELADAIAQHLNTPVDVLRILAERLVPVLDNGRNHQLGFKAGVLLCTNPRTPIKAIEVMLRPECASMQFRKVVARETKRRDVLEILLNDRSETVRARAQKNVHVLKEGQTCSVDKLNE